MKQHAKALFRILASSMFACIMAPNGAFATSGTWNGSQNAMWTNSSNWSASPYAGQSTSESATFNSAGNNNTNLNINGLFSLMNITFDTASVAAYTIGTGAANSQRIVIGYAGNYKITGTAANSQTFNCAVMLGGGSTSGSYTFQNDNTNRLLTFNNIYVTNVLTTAGTKTLTLAGSGNITVLGHITKNTASGITLNDSNSGTVSFFGTNVIATLNVNAGKLLLTGADGSLVTSGMVSVASGATLILTNSVAANHGNRVADASPIALTNATLAFAHAGGAAHYSETLGSVTVRGGGNVIRTSQADDGHTSTLTLASLVQATGAAIDFVGTGLGDDDRNRIFILGQANGPMDPGVTLNGASPVAYDSVNGLTVQSLTDIAAYGSLIVSNDAANVRINSQGTSGPIALSDATTLINSLTQNTAYDTSVDTAGKSLRLNTLTINASKASLTVGVNPDEGTVAPAAAGGALTLANNSASALTLNAAVADNESPSSLTKSGSGPAVLAGANTFSGSLSVSGGPLVLAHSLALQNILLGNTNGLVFDSSVPSHAFTVGGLTNAFAFALQDNAANPITLSVGNNNGSSTYGGVLSGGSFNKVGTGTLYLTAANTHTGGTTISEGTLRLGNKDALGPSGITNNGTLELPLGYVTYYSGIGASMSGTGTVNVTLGTGSDNTPLDGDYSGFSGTWNIGVGAASGAAKVRMNGADNPAATVNVLSNGTLYVAAPGPHNATAVLWGGDLGQNLGQLRLDSGAEWAGAVKLAGDITDAADGLVGSYTGTGTVSGVISDLGAPRLLKKVGAGIITLTGTNNTYAGPTWVAAGTLVATKLSNLGEPGSLGQPVSVDSNVLQIGSGTTATRFAYAGTGDATDRRIDLAGTTGGALLEQAGSGTLTFTSDLVYSGQGNKTLTLLGSTDGVGELAGVYANGAAATHSLIKSGAGTWILSAANTYSGETEVQDGTLVLTHPQALAGTSQLKFTGTLLKNATVELANDGGGETPVPTVIGVGYMGTIASGVGTGSVGINHTLGDLALSRATLTVCRASSVLSGSPAVTFGALNLNGNNSGYTTMLNPTDADIHLGSASILSGNYSKTLRLDGASSGNTIDGPVSNGINTLTLYKAGPGTWTLSGSNTYSGATTVNEGTLAVSGALGALVSSGSFTVNANGTLRLCNTEAANNTNRLADTKAIALNGGALEFSHTAGASDYSEKIGAVTVSGLGNRIAASQASTGRLSTLTLSSLTRNTGATLDFAGVGLGAADANRIYIGGQAQGLLGLWATYNGSGLAAYDASRGVYAGTESTAEIAAKGPSSVIPDDATADVRITTDGTSGPITLAGSSESRAGLLQQRTATDASVDTAGKTFRTHALLINTNQASLTIGQSEGDGALTSLATDGRLDLINNATATLTVNAAVAENGSSSSLSKTGPGDVVLKGPVAYTGLTTINNGALIFGGHAYPQGVTGIVGGAGSLIKTGTNLLHLLAANTYAGTTYVNAGTLRVNIGSALGGTAAGTVVADGATLDVGCTPDVGGTRGKDALNMQNEPLTVQGAGVGGQGAIINSSTGSQYNALGRITLAGDTVFGGQSRWDVRDSWFVMNDHKLTKVGPNVVSLSSTTNAPGEAGMASIDVQEGQFRLQRTASLGGSAANHLTLRGGTEFELYELDSDVPWSLTLEDGSALDALGSTASTQNRITGPAALNGEVSLVGGDGYYATLAGDLSGPGSLVKTNGSYFCITGTNNTYAGPTLLRGGSLYVASIRPVGEPSSLGQPADAAAGTIPIGSGSTSARLIYTGSGDTSDRVIDMAGTTGSAYLNHSGEGLLRLRHVAVSGGGTKTLYLEGSTSGVGEISGNITNGPSGTVALNKSGTGAWILSGNNTYSGTTAMNAGSLTYSGTNLLGGLTLYAGTVEVLGTNAYGTSAILIGASSGKNGTLVLSPDSSLSSSGGFRVGNTGGFGALLIDGGSFLNTAGDGDQNFAFARENNSYGYLRMTGGRVTASRFQMSGVTGSSYIGRSLARILGGTLSFSTYILIGRNPGCETVLTLDGGTLNHANATKNLGVPWAGGRAELNVTGGSVDNSGCSVTVLEGGGTYGTGLVNLCSGTLTTASVTNYSSGVALINFAGGTLTASANRTDFLPSSLSGIYTYGPFGAFAGGAVIDSAGKNVSVTAPIRAPTGKGVYAIALADLGQGSGYIGEPYVSIEGGEGFGATAVANLSDDGSGNGTYKVDSVTVTCPGTGYLTPPTVLFKGGGATNAIVAALAGEVTLADNASGGLTKTGAGVLTLGSANTYTGTTTVAGGTLKLGVANALSPATSLFLAGGTLDLNGSTISNAVSGSGTVMNGAVQAVLSPAGEGTVGTNTFSLAGATLTPVSYLLDVTVEGDSDRVEIQGDIDLSACSLQIVNPDLLNPNKVYTLLTCAGSRTGAFAPDNLPENRWHLSYPPDGSVRLIGSRGLLIRVH